MSNLFAMKYKINNSDWVIATDKTSEINVLGDFCYHNNATESPLVTYGSIGYVFKNRPESESDGLLLVGGAVFQGFTEQGGLIYAEGLVHHTEVGENTIIIKKMAEQLAKNTEFEQAQAKNSITFGQAFTDYFNTKKSDWSENYIKDHINSAKPYMSDKPYNDGCLAYIWHTSLSELTPDLVERWIRHENKTRKTRMAIAYRIYRAFVNWANERETYKDIIPTKSATAKIVSSAVAKTGRHKYSLQRSQLPLWFKTIKQIHPTHATVLICMLLNGSRPNEMLSLKWENVDFDWKTITIIDKVDQWERTIPLTPYTEYLIKQMPKHGDYIFATDKSDSYTELGRTYRTAILDAGLPRLPPKAMRKSFSNLSEWVSVPHGVVKQIMGHRPSATDEKHYKDRPIDLLRHWHIIIEQFILSEAGADMSVVYPSFDKTYLDKYVIDSQ